MLLMTRSFKDQIVCQNEKRVVSMMFTMVVWVIIDID